MSDDSYVTNSAWRASAGRADAIDEIADQFERPSTSGVESFWVQAELRRSAPARIAADSFLRRSVERRAG